MSSEVVRELFRNFENVLHDRLKVIEDILSSTSKSGSSGDLETTQHNLKQLREHFLSFEEYTMGQIRTLAYNHDRLEDRVVSLESSMKSTVDTFRTLNETIGMMQRRMDDEKPVEAAEVEAEIEETQEAALNADLDAVATEQKAQKAFASAVAQLPEEEEVEEEVVEEEVVEEEVVEEEVVEEEEVEEEVVEEEEEEEVEEEEVELEFEEFEYKKKTYYRDQNNNVYIADEEGCIDPSEVVGIWNPKTKKIDRVSST
jgi:hypothetical protein